MSKLKKLNRLNKSKTLSVAMAAGLVVANLVSAVPVFAASATTPAATHSITKAAAISAAVNKVTSPLSVYNTLAPADVVINLATLNTLTDIKDGKVSLELDTDYTVDGNVVTILQSYLDTLKVGTKKLTFDFDSGTDPSLSLTITNKQPALVSPTATFNNRIGKAKDVLVTVDTYGILPNGILYGDTPLEDGDYSIGTPTSAGRVKVTIKKEYLSELPTNKKTLLTFIFEDGTERTLTLNVTANVVSTTADISTVSAVNGTVTATFGSAPTVTPVVGDFVVKQAIGTAAATTVTPTLVWSGKVATFTVPTVAATTAAQSVVYSVAYKGGTAKTAAAFVVPASGTTGTLPAEVSNVVATSMFGNTYVTVTINSANVASVTGVTVNGQAATQSVTAGEWKAVLTGTVATSDLTITVTKGSVTPATLIVTAESSATYLSAFGQARVLVKTTADVTSVTVDGTAAVKNSSGLWKVDVNKAIGDTVAVVATNGTATDSATLTIK